MPDARPLICDDCGEVVRITPILDSEDWEAIAARAWRPEVRPGDPVGLPSLYRTQHRSDT